MKASEVEKLRSAFRFVSRSSVCTCEETQWIPSSGLGEHADGSIQWHTNISTHRFHNIFRNGNGLEDIQVVIIKLKGVLFKNTLFPKRRFLTNIPLCRTERSHQIHTATQQKVFCPCCTNAYNQACIHSHQPFVWRPRLRSCLKVSPIHLSYSSTRLLFHPLSTRIDITFLGNKGDRRDKRKRWKWKIERESVKKREKQQKTVKR